MSGRGSIYRLSSLNLKYKLAIMRLTSTLTRLPSWSKTVGRFNRSVTPRMKGKTEPGGTSLKFGALFCKFGSANMFTVS